MTPTETSLSKLPSAKNGGNPWSVRCPVHDDQSFLVQLQRLQPPKWRSGNGDDTASAWN